MTLPTIHVHPNKRHLQTRDGRPFFWLGDTAWELFHRLTREEAAHYFATRARQRFSVVQAVALAEFKGLSEPNQYGALPLVDRDPARPNDAYFSLVDEYISMAAENGLYVALLPTWGDKVAKDMWASENVVFTPENALAYGRWMGRRYRERSNVIWMLGGDRPAVHGDHDDRPVWRAMAAGIRESIPEALMVYHTMGGQSSSRFLHDEAWLDVNSMQSGHGSGHDVPVWEWVDHDLGMQPHKPTLDSEPNYEDHPVNPWPKWDAANGYFRDWDVRKQMYRSVFAGACGVTYGHHSMWQFYSPRVDKVNHAECYWTEALMRPGAEQMRHLAGLMAERPYFSRVPDQSLLLDAPETRSEYVAALRDAEGAYALAYVPNAGQAITLDLRALNSDRALAAWFDPRTGDVITIGDISTRQSHRFTTPMRGPDWVLTIDAL